jgi:ABC-type sugar transport system ATPase subunit
VRVKSFTKSNFDEREVVHAMVGPDYREILSSQEEVERAEEGHNSIEVNNFQSEGIDGASFSVAHGEILGVTGRPGGGASELLRLLAGIEPLIEGTLEIGNLQMKIRHPRDAINSGIYYISADRLLEGGVAAMTVAENLILPKNERYGLKRTKAAKDVAYIMSMLDIRPSNPFVSFGNLSGGNQQKVLLARWLLLRPRVLLLDDPTVGVDPYTRETIFQTLQTLSSNGTTILLRSSEPEQLARLCERVMIVRDGHIVMELAKNQMTIEEISVAAYA